MSQYREALAARWLDVLICPSCHAMNLVRSSSGQIPAPTIEPELDGSYTCTMCSTHWRPVTSDTAVCTCPALCQVHLAQA